MIEKPKFYVYCISPIDCFDHTMDIKQQALMEISRYLELDESGQHADAPSVISLWREAKKAIQEYTPPNPRFGERFDGTYRDGEGPRMFSVPSDGRFSVGFVIKQDGNGSTFVASPVPLPHLDRLT